MAVLKLIDGNKVNYVNDILNVEVDHDAKSIKIVYTTCDVAATVKFTNDVAWKRQAFKIEQGFMCTVPVEVYLNEEDLIKIIESEQPQCKACR